MAIEELKKIKISGSYKSVVTKICIEVHKHGQKPDSSTIQTKKSNSGLFILQVLVITKEKASALNRNTCNSKP